MLLTARNNEWMRRPHRRPRPTRRWIATLRATSVHSSKSSSCLGRASTRICGGRFGRKRERRLSATVGAPLHCTFVPHLAPITRGIHSTITATLAPGATIEQVVASWRERYRGRVFVRVRSSPKDVEVANTTGTNFIDIAAVADGRTLIIASALDNLVKGASGQAVQNLNLMFGLPEESGLLRRGM